MTDFDFRIAKLLAFELSRHRHSRHGHRHRRRRRRDAKLTACNFGGNAAYAHF